MNAKITRIPRGNPAKVKAQRAMPEIAANLKVSRDQRHARTAKEAIQLAAERLGGAERLFRWAQESPENERDFWTRIYVKLLPLQVSTADQGLIVQVVRYSDTPIQPPKLINGNGHFEPTNTE